jgi:hypothetical protein
MILSAIIIDRKEVGGKLRCRAENDVLYTAYKEWEAG